MKKLEIKIPSVGESVSQADIESWEKKTGDRVEKGDILALIETDKASLEIPAEQSGRLTIVKKKGETVSIGEVIGFIDTNTGEIAQKNPSDHISAIPSAQTPKERRIEVRNEWEELKKEKRQLEQEIQNIKNQADRKFALYKNQFPDNKGLKTNAEKLYQEVKKLEEQKSELEKDIQLTKEKWDKLKETAEKQDVLKSQELKKDFNPPLSPAVRHLAGEHKLNTDALKGTGKEGRLTKEDILQALKEESSENLSPDASLPKDDLLEPAQETLSKTGQKREKMTSLRKTIAERLVQSQQMTATLSTFNEVDMSRIMEMRQKYQDRFIKKHEVKLGFMGFFVQAVVFALKQYPRINAFIEGENIVYNSFCHIGVAISTEGGLVVPVIKKADEMSLADIEKQIKFYSEKARKRKLDLQDLSGGTFTISNGGVFGSLLSTPILNPPQSGILGMHKIENRPVAVEGQVQIRPMMYLTLSYDHRIVDGREGVGFLAKVKEAVEEPARILMDV